MVGAKKYWIPWRSIPSIDKIAFKCGIPACAASKGGIVDCGAMQVERFKNRRSVDYKDHPTCK